MTTDHTVLRCVVMALSIMAPIALAAYAFGASTDRFKWTCVVVEGYEPMSPSWLTPRHIGACMSSDSLSTSPS